MTASYFRKDQFSPLSPRSSAWPHSRQRHLLHAATGPKEESLAAWVRYCDGEPSWGEKPEAKVFPAVYFRLSRIHGLTDFPHHDRLKNIYRATYVANRCLLESALPALGALEKSGIEVCLLKGAALVGEYYRDLGARAMTDVDALVAEDQISAAASQLKSLGWSFFGAYFGLKR